ncbi:MAG: ABC transporter substrate-binding protein [Candidatus Planktophila sp.]|jgi:NitT/TauT family transport system substrate-binding protein
MKFSTSQRVKKSQAAVLATMLIGSILVVTSPASNAAGPVKAGKACSQTEDTVAQAKKGQTLACKSGKWTRYESASLVYAATSSSYGAKEEFAVYSVPQQLGYFKNEKLTVSIVPSGGSVDAVNLVSVGRVDITGADLGSALSGIQKGANIKVIGGLVMNFPWKMATDPSSSIKKPADLKGKTIGIISTGSGSWPFAKAWLTGHGISYSGNKFVSLGGSIGPAKVALFNGSVDAIAYYTAGYAGEEFLGTKFNYLETPQALIPVRSLSWIVNADKYAENPEIYERFLRAAFKGLTYSSTNLKSATTLGFTELPAVLAGATVDSKIGSAMASLKAWLESATPLTGAPATWNTLGSINTREWVINQAYAKAAGTITTGVSRAKYFDGSNLARANTFDREPIVAAANKAPK